MIFVLMLQPEDYEPPFFRKCSENESACTWAKTPLKMEVGSVNSRHLLLSLKVHRAETLCTPIILPLALCSLPNTLLHRLKASLIPVRMKIMDMLKMKK